MSIDTVSKAATLSNDGRYRYRLIRTWDPAAERVTFVMLNPSTADAMLDDPTIRRCIGFARSWGFGGLDVVNLYALRSTDPAGLWAAEDPVGPYNDHHLEQALMCAPLIVAAWGANAKADRVARFWALAREHRDPPAVKALRVTKAGAPGHPLYIPAAAPLVPYAPA